ncbi:endopeptidase La [Pyrinomonas methylaliphatogenes]|jgi:ATP-dependent Lon protease|uniref:Lon protease n=1 Tax=Pyrinomonas methylaliphatogenes TaxID=454194 RepID=A0A0B6WZ72_9BACT|nr:endopeptidase La [Pyrinomonas methylaliphatogenes]MBX5477607.1 endopeptidase La [Pyrinomonas methylaliphatogenes]CDM66558.1 ATP-dependent proteinase [Pyrinomonas methylaliphatogenes]
MLDETQTHNITEFGASGGDSNEQLQIPEVLPVLPLRDIVIYPFMIVPLFVSRERSIRAVDHALSENRMILLLSQKDLDKEEPTAEDLYTMGTVALVMRMLKLPDGRTRILVQGLARARAEEIAETNGFLSARLTVLHEPPVPEDSLEVEALIRNVRALLEKAANLGKNISPEVMAIAANLDDPGRLADLAASNLELRVEEAQSVLNLVDTLARLRRVNELLNREIEVLTVQQEINTQARADIDRSQREFFLRQQLKAIQAELGEGNELAEEIAQFQKKIAAAGMPPQVEEEVQRQLKKLERMHPDAAETATLRNWLEIMVELPWSKSSKDNLDLAKAARILDEDHYGLEKVKERILEALAVRKLKEKPKGPILCLVGPPGVGKTSLGRSIARALDRKFVRLSLGGLHDEAEIRGHRRTYVGAMPGRIIQALQQAGTNNPLIMLDEIDKVGADFRGDPSSALLEVLDPEQNNSFRDNYLGVPFDLSNVMFMTTANVLDTIQPALRDRMEIIQLSGYTEEEKLEIARRHLLPKQMEENGITPRHLQISRRALAAIINQYTQEAGLRQLEREIGKICRKVARRVAEGRTEMVRVSLKNLHEFLGAPKVQPDEILRRDQIGVATGLAWTAVGGDVLFIEALRVRGKGNLVLTGQLGDVMKESAQAAFSYAKARARELGIPEEDFNQYDLHIHIPEGAIPKDGPSAGITLATAMVSVLSQRPVRRDVAMTGEITLRGNVLPVGGIKEKVLAARRARVATIILPQQNRRDLDEIPKELFTNLRFVFVDNVQQVFREALREKISTATSASPRQAKLPQAAAPSSTDSTPV